MYKQLIRPLLFRMPPETAHVFTLKTLKVLRKIPFASQFTRMIFNSRTPHLSRKVFDLDFPNPVGLAAGIDKNGECYNELRWFGFSFVEIGSLTPLAQAGNHRPRLFRLPQDNAIINRMGINNRGIRFAINHILADPPRTIIAASLAKNTSSSSDKDIIEDYKTAFSRMYDFADMFTINVSCPNVEGLQNLQDVSSLSDIIDPLLELRICYDVYKPILIKLSPDIPSDELEEILKYCLLSGVDGIVAGNTTRSREGLKTPKSKLDSIGEGGLSGEPLFPKSLALVKKIHDYTDGRLPVIGVGGIMSSDQAKQMLDAGASLIEICSGFIYEGPGLVKRIVKRLDADAVAAEKENNKAQK